MNKIIDGHVHLWSAPKPGYEGRDVPGFPFPRTVDGSVESLLAQMKTYNIARAIVVQSPWWEHDPRYMLDVAERFPGLFTLVNCTPMDLANIDPAATAARLGRDRMAGMRFHVSGSDALNRLDRGDFAAVFARLSDLGYPALFIGRAVGAFRAYDRIANSFPSLNIVVDHMGYASAPFGATASMVESLLALSRRPRAHVKIAIHHQHSQQGYPWSDVIPLQQKLIGAFGANRILWGSNWPMREPTYEQRLDVMTHHFPFASADDRAWIMGRTAESLWPSVSAVKSTAEKKAQS